jgi:hypothetical protein
VKIKIQDVTQCETQGDFPNFFNNWKSLETVLEIDGDELEEVIILVAC